MSPRADFGWPQPAADPAAPLPDMACGNCIYFQAMPDGSAGRCRRYQPAMVLRTDGRVSWLLPILNADDWCGEHVRRGGEPT